MHEEVSIPESGDGQCSEYDTLFSFNYLCRPKQWRNDRIYNK